MQIVREIQKFLILKILNFFVDWSWNVENDYPFDVENEWDILNE